MLYIFGTMFNTIYAHGRENTLVLAASIYIFFKDEMHDFCVRK